VRGFYPSCDNSDEHRREAEDDFRHSRFSPNIQYETSRHYDDCAAAYMDRFEELNRQERERREQREQEQYEEEQHYRREQQRQLEQEAEDNFCYYEPGGPFEQVMEPMEEEP